MVPVYAIALFVGFLMLLAWIVGALAGAAAMVVVARVLGPDTA